MSEEVRLAFFESLFGGESRVPESDEDAMSLFTLCDEVGFRGFDHARRSRFDIGSSWTAEERSLFFDLKALVDEHCERFASLEYLVADQEEDVRARLIELEVRIGVAEARMRKSIDGVSSSVAGKLYDLGERLDRLESRLVLAESGMRKSIDDVSAGVARVEESIGCVSEESRRLRCDVESITSSLANLKASERESCPVRDLGIGSSLNSALIDRREWEFYGSSVCVALHALADVGSSEAANMYGSCLEHGYGVGQNLEEAARYYKLSADQGDAVGQYHYGVCLAKGRGVGWNIEEAARYYKLSADQGNAKGQCCYGMYLEHGIGVSQSSEDDAVRYYKLSADQGNARGQCCYGYCLEFGIGVRKR